MSTEHRRLGLSRLRLWWFALLCVAALKGLQPAVGNPQNDFGGEPRIFVQTGHQKPVYFLTFYEDGERLASIGFDGILHLWDLANATELPGFRLTDPGQGFGFASNSASGLAVVFRREPLEAVVWEVPTRGRLITLPGFVLGAFNQDGTSLALATSAGAVEVIDPNTGRRISRFRGTGRPIDELFFMEDSLVSITTRIDAVNHRTHGVARVRDPSSGQALYEVPWEGSGGWQISPNGRRIVFDAGTFDVCRLYTLSLEPGARPSPLSSWPGNCNSLAFSADGKRLAVAGDMPNLEVRGERGALFDVLPTEQPTPESRRGTPATRILETVVSGVNRVEATTIHILDSETGLEVQRMVDYMGSTHALAFSPDGSMLASAGELGQIRLWQSEIPLAALPPQPDSVSALAFSSNSRSIAVATGDDTVRLIQLPAGEEKYSATACAVASRVLALGFSPDTSWLAAGCSDGRVQVLDAGSGLLLRSLTGHQGDVTSLAFHARVNILATGSADRTVRIWDTDTAGELAVLSTKVPVSAVTVYDGEFAVAAGLEDGSITLWRPGNSGLDNVGTFAGHQGRIGALEFSQPAKRVGGALLASGSEDGTIRIWSLEPWREHRRLVGHDGPVTGLAWSENQEWIASSSMDGTIRYWEIETAAELKAPTPLDEPVSRLARSPFGVLIVSGGAAGRLELHEFVTTGTALRVELGSSPRAVGSSRISPDGRWLATAGGSASSHYTIEKTLHNHVRLVDLHTGDVQTLAGHAFSVNDLAFSTDSHKLLTGGADLKCVLWDVRTGNVERVFEKPTEHRSALLPITHVALSGDGRWMAEQRRGVIRVWSVDTAKNVATLLKNNSGQEVQDLVSMAFSKNGDRLTALFEDRTAQEWSIPDGTILLEGRILNEYSRPIVWSPVGEALAVARNDGAIVVLDGNTGKVIQELNGHLDQVQSLGFAAGGSRLISSGYGRIQWWNTQTGELEKSIKAPGITAMAAGDRFVVWGQEDLTEDLDRARRLFIQDLETGETDVLSSAHNGTVMALAVTPDGRSMVSVAEDERINVWDVPSRRLRREITWAQEGEFGSRTNEIVTDIALSKDGTQVAVSTIEESGILFPRTEVRIFDLQTGRLKSSFSGKSEAVFSMAFDPNRNRIATNDEKTILLTTVDAASGREESQAFAEDEELILDLAYHPNGARLASVTVHGTLRIWDVETGLAVASSRASPITTTAAALAEDGNLAAWVENDASVRLGAFGRWEHEVAQLDAVENLDSLALSASGSFVAMRETSGQVTVVDEDGAVRLSAAMPRPRLFMRQRDIAFGQANPLFAIGGTDGSVQLWDLDTGRMVSEFEGHQGGDVTFLAFAVDDRWVLTGDSAGMIRLWDVESGTLNASMLLATSDESWVVAAPDGRFDGSADGWHTLLWQFSIDPNDVSPADAFFQDFFAPGLLAAVLAGEPAPATGLSELDRRQPELTITLGPNQSVESATDTVTVQIAAREAREDGESQGAGVRDLRLFRNQTLVRAWRGPMALDENGLVTVETEVPLLPDANQITAYGFNSENVKSTTVALPVPLMGDPELADRDAFILAIGVNEYRNAELQLKYAVADANIFAIELRHHLKQTEIGDVEMVVLEDEKATRSGILAAIGTLAEQASPGDAVFFMFAGHGMAVADRFYLLPHDLGYEGFRAEFALHAPEILRTRGISDRDLETAFDAFDASPIVMIIDACNSGQALESEEMRRGPMNSKGLAQLAYEKNIMILTASQSYQAALEVDRLGHGLLTYSLVEEGLVNGYADRSPADGVVSLREWIEYATDRVPDLQREDLSRSRNVKLAFVEGEEDLDPEERRIQRPRAFYRSGSDSTSFVVARMHAAPTETLNGRLRIAALRGDMLQASELLDQGASSISSRVDEQYKQGQRPDWSAHEDQWRTAVELAARGESVDMVELLFQGLSEEEKRAYLSASLFEAAGSDAEASDAILRKLVELGAEVVTPRNNEGQPLLAVAAKKGTVHAISALIELGASVEEADEEEQTPLIHAARHGRIEAIQELLAAGARIEARSEDGTTALIVASRHSNAETVRALLAAGAESTLDAVTDHGWSALMHAAAAGQAITVELLLVAGADVELSAESGGARAIHLAARNGKTAIVERLVRAGADVNAPCIELGTPLFTAAFVGAEETVRALLRGGAHPHSAGPQGNATALQAARAKGYRSIEELLRGQGTP